MKKPHVQFHPGGEGNQVKPIITIDPEYTGLSIEERKDFVKFVIKWLAKELNELETKGRSLTIID